MTPKLSNELQEFFNLLLLPRATETVLRPEIDFLGRVRSLLTQVKADATGGFDLPDASDVRNGVAYGDGHVGTLVVPAVSDVRSGTTYGHDAEYTGDLVLPTEAQVIEINFGYEGEYTGTVVLPTAAQVLDAVTFGASGETTGTVVLPSEDDVRLGVTYGPASATTGTVVLPAAENVVAPTQYGADGTEFTGTHT